MMTIKLKIHLTEWYITHKKDIAFEMFKSNDCFKSSTWLCFTIAWRDKE